MAKLTARDKKFLLKKKGRPAFGLPAKAKKGPEGGAPKGAYPMPDKTHAMNAKARAKQQYDKGNLSRSEFNEINRRANRVLKAKGAKTIGGKPVKKK